MKDFSKVFILCSTFLLTACAEDDPQQFISEGQALFEKGEMEAARVQFKNALQLNPRLAQAYYGLALLDEKTKNWSGMKQNLLETVTLDPKHLEGQVKLGLTLASDIGKAKEKLAIVQKLDPDDLEVILLDASIKYLEGEEDAARKLVDRILAKDQTHADAIRLLVIMLSDEKRFEEALSALDSGIQGNPNDLDLRLLKISKLTDLKRDDDVIHDYADLVATFPEDKSLRRTQIEALMRIGKAELVEQAIKDAISNHPTDISFKLAMVGFVERTDSEKVEVLLKEYLKEHPNEAGFKFRLAGFYLKYGRRQEAQTLFNQIAEAYPTGKEGLTAKTRLVEIALKDKDNALAKKLADEVLKIDGDSSEALLIRAEMRLDRKEIDEAISDLRIVLRDRPDSDQAMVLMARANIINGELEVAQSYWKKAIEANPNNLAAIVPLVSALIMNGDSERAEEMLVKSIKANPGNTALVEVLVKVRSDKKDWAGAEAVVNELKQLPNGDLAAQMLFGLIAEKQGRQLDAIGIYKDVLSKQPNSNGALIAIARSYSNLGRNADFIAFMTNFIKENPSNFLAFNMLGELYGLAHNWKEAEKVLQESLALEPKAISTYRLLGGVLTQQGRLSEVVELIRSGLAVLPENEKLLMELARHFDRSKELEKAKGAYEDVLNKYPLNDEAANNLASLLTDSAIDTTEFNRALTLVERLKNSPNPFFLDTYGWVLFKSGNADKAIDVLKTVVDIAPNVAVFRYHLGEVYHGVNNQDATRVELKKALVLAQQQGGFVGIERARQLLKELGGNT